MKIIVMAILVEAIWETMKMVFQEGKFSYDKLGAILISILFCFTYKLDVFELIGMEAQFSYVGLLGTGIIASRGANFVHDLLGQVEKGL